MKQKIKVIFKTNLIFYIFVVIHSNYFYDDVPQIIFYMALCFSTVLIDKEERDNKNEIIVYAVIDLSIRIIVLIIHFGYIYYIGNTAMYYIIVGTLFVVNIFTECILYNKFSNEQERNIIVSHKDLNKFIEECSVYKYKDTKYDLDLRVAMKNLELSGKSNIVLILLFVLLIISKIIFNNFKEYFIIIICFTSLLIYWNFKISSKITNSINYRSIVMFIIGYVILLCGELFGPSYIGVMNVTVRLAGLLFFIPIFNEKYEVKKKVEKLYCILKDEVSYP